MVDLDEQERSILREIKQQNDTFKFIGEQITSQQVSSMLPFFDCEEPGHQGNALDQVCLHTDCKYKGLCCVRCQYQQHRSHPNSIFPLHTFVAQLIQQSSQRGIVLQEQLRQCTKYREVVSSVLKDFVNSVVEHTQTFMTQLQKYHSQFESSHESVIVRSQILVHSLIYKKHIRKDRFQRYVRESVRCVQITKAYRPSSDCYTISEPRQSNLQDKMIKEFGGIVIEDQERAFQMSSDYLEELQGITNKLQGLTQRHLEELREQGNLQKLSNRIPVFEKLLDDIQLSTIGSRNKNRTQNLNVVKSQNNLSQLTTIPSLNEYLVSSSTLDCSRTICTLGTFFESIGNCSIVKQKPLRSTLNDINCISLLGSTAIAVGGKFHENIEIYRISDRKHLGSINTRSVQGVKVMLTMTNDDGYSLIIGLYAEESCLLSYDIKVHRDAQTSSQNTTFIKADHDTNAAVTCLKELLNSTYFVAGFSTGTVATYHKSHTQPLHILKQLYEIPVCGITVLDVGKVYLTWAGDRCRFHYVQRLSEDSDSSQNISPLKHLPASTLTIQAVQSLVEEERNVFVHLICGELKSSSYQRSEIRESGLRFMRIMRDEARVTLVEEGALSNFKCSTNNSVKEVLVIEPRKRMNKIWVVLAGANNKLQLWEVRRAMSQNIRLWEKDLEDFLKPMNTNIVKCRLVGESRELTELKYVDVGPRAQIVEVKENASNGRYNILICIVNHESKCEVDFFDIELLSL